MHIKILKSLYKQAKESSLFGRYIRLESITPLLENLSVDYKVETLGYSVNNLPIHSVTFGHGSKKILMWSQMHGNESTTTKAVFDIFNAFALKNEALKTILKCCEIKIIPILNPDGAKAYTRVNANQIDLNRDAQDLSQPESQVLRDVFDAFKPNYCYNLHGQRTIFSAGDTRNSATVSFLSPAQDKQRTVTKTRMIAMELIAIMNKTLQIQIKDQVGIYDDEFNTNCVGDTFQAANFPTILFEAGHRVNDYEREETRKYIFQSLVISLNYIAHNEINGNNHKPYFKIPQNKKLFYDIIIRNTKHGDIAIQFEERLVNEVLKFIPKIEKISDLKDYYGHKEIDANGSEVFTNENKLLTRGNEIDFVVINNEKIVLKP